nr:BON domain-containing protein [Bacteriovorax sp. HI3]
MKLWSILMVMVLCTSFNSAMAKQGPGANPRVVDQETGLTAGDQSNKPQDVLVTKKIRAELMKDAALSMKAKNIKIIVINNGVTLKGNVATADERARILEHAYVTAPKHKIYNQISVVK